jgi:hypothetical protein
LGLWMLRACSVSSGSSMAWMPDLKSMGWSQRPTEDSFSRNVLSLRSCSAKLW